MLVAVSVFPAVEFASPMPVCMRSIMCGFGRPAAG